MSKVTVFMPVYNAERYVADAINSILVQTFKDFSLIIIDDGSTDNSLAEIRRAVGRDPRCKVTSRENKGIVATRNEGLCETFGEYLFLMDADDISHLTRLAEQVRYLDMNPECVALGTRVMLADDELAPIIAMVGSFTHEEIDAENLRGQGSAMCNPSVAMRRDALLTVGGYRADYECAEDLDLFLRLAEIGRLVNLPEVLLTYRQHLGSVGYSKRQLQAQRTALAVDDAKRRRSMTHGTGQVAPATPVPAIYASTAEIHRKWGWLSLQGGHPTTARKHAWKALKLEPFSPANPRLLACAIRGR